MVCASDSVPPRQRVVVRALIRELTACMLFHAVKTKGVFSGTKKVKGLSTGSVGAGGLVNVNVWPIYVYPSVAVSTTGPSNVDPRPCVGCEVRDG